MRHTALLSDEALDTLEILLKAMEHSGFIPAQVRALLAILLPKAAMGTGPIANFPSCMRMRGGCRHCEEDRREAAHYRDYSEDPFVLHNEFPARNDYVM